MVGRFVILLLHYKVPNGRFHTAINELSFTFSCMFWVRLPFDILVGGNCHSVGHRVESLEVHVRYSDLSMKTQ